MLMLAPIAMLIGGVASATLQPGPTSSLAVAKEEAPKSNHALSNLVYIKVPKTASSTFGSVVRRIANGHGLSGVKSNSWITTEPGVWANHSNRSDLQWRINKLKKPAFLMSILRDPAERCLSEFYHFKVLMGGWKLTTENKVNALRKCTNYQARYLIKQNWGNQNDWLVHGKYAKDAAKEEMGGEWDDPDAIQKCAENIMASYDFLGVDTMFDETVLKLAHQLDTAPANVLYLDAKVSGANGSTVTQARPPLSEEPQEVHDFLDSDQWKKTNAVDYKLIELATTAIQGSMSKAFSMALAQFRMMRKNMAAKCEGETASLNPDNCYFQDNGCGYPCMDSFVADGGTKLSCEAHCEGSKAPWEDKCKHWLDCSACDACSKLDWTSESTEEESSDPSRSAGTAADVWKMSSSSTKQRLSTIDGSMTAACMDPSEAVGDDVHSLSESMKDELRPCAGASDCVQKVFCRAPERVICAHWQRVNCKLFR